MFRLALVGIVTIGLTGCQAPKDVKVSIVLSNDFRGFAVILQDTSSRGQDAYTLHITNENRTVTFVADSRYTEDGPITRENGTPMPELDNLQGDETGYKWIQYTGHVLWLFVGTKAELAALRNQVIEIDGRFHAIR